MSENSRKNINSYTMTNHYKGARVFRPKSMRAVSAEKELNRMLTLLESQHTQIKELKYQLQELQEFVRDDSRS